MENSVIRGRDRAAKVYLLARAGLGGTGKISSVGQEVIDEIHSLFVRLILKYSLLRFAAEVEVGDEAPIIPQIQMLVDDLYEVIRLLHQVLFPARLVSQNDPEVDRRISAPVGIEVVTPSNDAWAGLRLNAVQLNL